MLCAAPFYHVKADYASKILEKVNFF